MEVVEFRFLNTNDSYDTKYEAWSRIYEYPLVLQKIKELGGNENSKIHNSSWGFQGVHITFKEDLENLYPQTLHSDVFIPNSYPNVIKYDITKSIEEKYHNYFDFVLNISTVEEVPYNNIEIIKNLFEQVKIGGHLILTFDYNQFDNNREGNGSMNLNSVENFISKKIENRPENILNGNNSYLPCSTWSHLNCGLLIIKKLEQTLEGNSIQHLKFFLDKIKKNEPFSLIRPNDGEFRILQDDRFTNIDNWTFNGGILKDDLSCSIQKASKLENSYIGIPCKDCWDEANTQWYIENFNIDDSHLTYGNIVCNKNWKKFVNYFKENNVEFYYIGPGKSENDFKVLDRFFIDEKQVNRYEEERTTVLENLRLWVESKINPVKTSIFLFSAGPLSKIFIPNLFEIYPNNIYIDCGSSLDLDFKGISNREYIVDSMKYTNVICDFKFGHKTKFHSEEDIKLFEGGWSYSQKEMRDFFENIFYKENYNILEFGGGNSTKKLYDIFEKYCENICYDVYESNPQFLVNHKKVNTILYKTEEIDSVKILDKKYDVILIDGPNGNLRAKWYSKIREHINYDSIILIDDYNHYKEFETELNNNFNYKVLSASDEPFVPYGEHSWRIITNIQLKPQSGDITCILNVYKRPHCLKEQLEAVLSQTLPPKKIIIYKNYAEGILTLPNDVLEIAFKNNVTIVNSSENFGVWARFAVALLAKTTYICIFDDDTIPGKKWFENCYTTMLKVNGLLGTIGVVFQPSPDRYIMKSRFGWDSCNKEITQVDIVGHSWFFKREWLSHLWSIVPDYEFMDVSGEDMGFSYALQKVGIKTYVPPHPKEDLEMFGSMPDKAYKYGMEPHCVSFTSWPKFDKMYKFYRDKGFKFLEDK